MAATNEKHLELMRLTIDAARESREESGKTPIYVGAVVVKNGEVLAKACRGEFCAGEHAEYAALERRLKDTDLTGATLYTTLEPCIIGSHGTEKYRWPCANWIVERGIGTVWIGILDPNPNICGRGEWHLIDKGVSVERFPSELQDEIRELNPEFIEKKQKIRLVPLANRRGEIDSIWRFLERLQFEDERYYGSRLLWFCGPGGIGKSELLEYLRIAAQHRGIIGAVDVPVLQESPPILRFQQIAGMRSQEIEAIKNEGGNPQEYVCAAVAGYLAADPGPKVLILDSDYHFRHIGELSELVSRLLSQLQHVPYVGIVVATRKRPLNISAHTLRPLDRNDVEDMYRLNKWQIRQGELDDVYTKSKGNPLLITKLHAYYVVVGKAPGSMNMTQIQQDFLSHLHPTSKAILKTLAVALSAPFEMEKVVDKDIVLATIPAGQRALAEKALEQLRKMLIVHIKNSHIWMHDELIETIVESLAEDEAIEQHHDLAQLLKDKDPLGALWHFSKSRKLDETIELLEPAQRVSREQLQIMRLNQVFAAAARWFEELTKLEVRTDIKATMLFQMGNIFQTLAEVEDKAKNCQRAIEAYEQALKVSTLDRFPRQYATTQNNLGNAYRKLAEVEDKAKNCKRAIEAYEQALEVRTLDRFPMQYAMTQHNLGNTYGTLAEVEDKAKNCKRAIEACKQALEVRTLDRFPMDYAMTQNSLGIAYRKLAEVEDKAKNCKRAIKACEEALKVYTLDGFPMDYAMAQTNLGNAYGTLAEVEDKAGNCQRAIEAYEQARKVYTVDRFPMQYATTQTNLGNAHGRLAEVEDEDQAGNCKRAIKACEEALKVYTLDRFPMQYAAIQNNLGNAYRTLAGVEDKAGNCQGAIEAYEQALKVYTLDRFPMDYAMTQNNLGNAYRTLAEVEDEDKAGNCKRAIKAYKEALEVRTLDRFPMQYAMTQTNLGNAYGTLAKVEDKAKNCKRAIEACKQALKVYTLDRFPTDYAMAQNNLGAAYGTLAEVEDKAKNCNRAIKAYKEALRVFTKEESPEAYRLVERNLRILLDFCGGE